jgi:hypothetical protein
LLQILGLLDAVRVLVVVRVRHHSASVVIVGALLVPPASLPQSRSTDHDQQLRTTTTRLVNGPAPPSIADGSSAPQQKAPAGHGIKPP